MTERFQPTHEITHNGTGILVQEVDGVLYTSEEWDSATAADWEFSADDGELRFHGQVPTGESSFRRLPVRLAYQVQIRNTRGSGEWAGHPLGHQWMPAIAGTLNQLHVPDAAASTADSHEEAEEYQRLVLQELAQGGYEFDESGANGHGYEVRIATLAE